ncbi:response regulator [Fulvivirga lutimaris]|uniref:response regulator n=1 Tax=Fulvivirga lutimaris TaxID=1819566 RepID=UPI0012BC3A7D|nr:response regulator transcription factor [Fulvivirga lutimaris]MTI40048.1 response regulator transcription factor [Fulvivirga lutimaris]
MSSVMNILLVDDHSLIRDGIKSLLIVKYPKANIHEAKSGKEALSLAQSKKLDIIVLDISLPDMNGMQIAESLIADKNPAKIVMLSMYSDYDYVSSCIEIGVNGYILKNEGHEIVDAIESLAEGKAYYSTGVRDLIVNQYTQKVRKQDTAQEVVVLTNREKEVIKHVVEGKTSHEIAEMLFISARTVDTHRSNIMKKLKVKNSIALINKINELDLLG